MEGVFNMKITAITILMTMCISHLSTLYLLTSLLSTNTYGRGAGESYSSSFQISKQGQITS